MVMMNGGHIQRSHPSGVFRMIMPAANDAVARSAQVHEPQTKAEMPQPSGNDMNKPDDQTVGRGRSSLIHQKIQVCGMPSKAGRMPNASIAASQAEITVSAVICTASAWREVKPGRPA